MGEEKKKEGGEQRGKINERPTYKRERERTRERERKREREREREREKERERERDRDRNNKRKNMMKLNQSKTKSTYLSGPPTETGFLHQTTSFIYSCIIEM